MVISEALNFKSFRGNMLPRIPLDKEAPSALAELAISARPTNLKYALQSRSLTINHKMLANSWYFLG